MTISPASLARACKTWASTPTGRRTCCSHIAEDVVVHGMAHVHEPHHAPEFWRRVERAMPDYERPKDWLAQRGMVVVSRS